MKTRTLGTATVSAIGLGGMPMSIEGRPDRERALRTIHAALDAGVTLIDTADAYHLHADEVGHNEELIAEALAHLRRRHRRRPGRHQGRPPAPRRRLVDRSTARPEHLKQAVRGARSSGSASTRSASTSSTGPTRRSRTRSRSARSATCSTRARSARPASPTRTPTRSAGRRRSSAAGWSACRTSSRRAFRSSEPELRALRRAGHRLPAVEPARRHQPRPADLGSRSRRSPRSRDAHGVSPQQVALAWDARQVAGGHPDPGLEPAGDDPRLGAGRRPRAHRRRARRARRDGPARLRIRRTDRSNRGLGPIGGRRRRLGLSEGRRTAD